MRTFDNPGMKQTHHNDLIFTLSPPAPITRESFVIFRIKKPAGEKSLPLTPSFHVCRLVSSYSGLQITAHYTAGV